MTKIQNKINSNLFLSLLLQYSRDNNYNHIIFDVHLNKNPAYKRQVLDIYLKRISKKYGNTEFMYLSTVSDNATNLLSLINKLKENMFSNFDKKIIWNSDLLKRHDQEFSYREIKSRDQYNNIKFELIL